MNMHVFKHATCPRCGRAPVKVFVRVQEALLCIQCRDEVEGILGNTLNTLKELT